ncbi:ABC transporter permease [candidate division KSB1 bacterium]|nr:ABC transporter permease [candidate division KSB1 bacterium]
MKKLLLILRSIFKNGKLNAIMTLSMGLGLATAGIILSYVYQEFHYDAGHNNSEHVFRVVQGAGNYGPFAEILKSNFQEVKETARVAFFYGYLACTAEANKFNETSAIFADPAFFDVFSYPLVTGNSASCLIAPNSVVLSEKAALKYFNDGNPIGKQLKIGDEQEFTVTGIFQNFKANSNFKGNLILPLEKVSQLTQIWVEPSWRHGSDIHTFVLLDQHTNTNELAQKTDKLVSQFTQESLDSHIFQPLKNIHVEQFYWESTSQANLTYLYILIGVAILILCVASSNFIFLFVGIKSQQKTGAGIKKVCGASKTTLFLEYFTEVLLLMGFSVLVAGIFYTFYHVAAKEYFDFLPDIQIFDFKLLLILFSVVAGVALLSGLYPALALSSQMPARFFSSQHSNMPGKVKFVNKLVVVQFALCISLIISAMIMHNQVHFMENRNTGYAKDELITIPLNMHIGRGIYNEKFGTFAQELKKYPSVKNVSMAFSSPSSVITSGDVPPDWQGKPDEKVVQMYWESVSYDYFETIGVQIAKGRSFSVDFPADMTNWDTRTGAYILNKAAIQAMELEDPIGKEFRVWGFKGPIIGVVDDYNFKSMRSAITPMFYMANPFFWNEIVVRINPKSATVLADIKTVWDQFAPDYPLEFHFVNDKIRELYYEDKNLARSLNLFSILAIAIASMGLFALTLLSTNQRIKEIGIRKVVGASVTRIVFLLSKDYLKLVVIANMIAWPLAWYTGTKWLENFAYRIEIGWWMFALAGGIALAIAWLTVSWQAIRAATANPVEALRYE